MKPNVAKSLIKSAPKDLIDSLCECGFNILHGSVPLTPRQHRNLMKYKTPLRNLCDKSKGCSVKRRKTILQKGGFLGALLKPVLGVLASTLLN